MYFVSDIIFLLFFFYNVYFCKSQFCLDEKTTFTQNGISIEIRWSQSKLFSNLSDPPCVDRNNVLITRECYEGKWFPKDPPICHSVQKSFVAKCLNGDVALNNNYCMYISDPQKWSPDVPVFDVERITKYDFLEYLYKNRSITPFWLPVQRMERYGKLVWTIPMNYSEVFESEYLKNQLEPGLESLNCIIISDIYKIEDKIHYKIQLEDCNRKHRIVHVYKLEKRYFMKGKHLIYSSVSNNAYFLETNCKHLAQPHDIEDNFVIKKLVGYQTCRVGIERHSDGKFKWKKSKFEIHYTDWIPTTNFSNSVVVVTKDGWALENELNEIKCSICQIDHNKYKTDLTLNPNKNHTELILTTISAVKFQSITCKTIGLDNIDLKVSFLEIPVDNNYSEHNRFETLNERRIWRLKVLNDTLSNYFRCAGLIEPSGNIRKTKEIFLGHYESTRKFTLQIKVNQLCKDVICDPHFSDFYKNLTEFLHIILIRNIRFLTKVKTMKILKIKNGDIDMLYHLHVGDVTNVNADYLLLLKNLTQITTNDIYYLNKYKLLIKVNTLKSCEGCISDTTIIENQHVSWNFTKIGRTSSSVNKCKHKNLFAIRECGGNYVFGAMWKKPKIISKRNNEEITGKFCDLYEKRLDISPITAAANLHRLTKRKRDLNAEDIFYVAEIIRNISETKIKHDSQKTVAQDISLLMNNLIGSTINSTDDTNKSMNSTNILLASVEKFMQENLENDLDEHGVNAIVCDNYLYHISDPFVSGVSGVALITPEENSNVPFTKYEIKYITANMTIEQIISWKNLETAVYVPELLLDNIRNKTVNNVRISISFYYNDSLFIETHGNATSKTQLASRVFEISIKGYENYLYSFLPVITKVKMNSFCEKMCGFWDYGSQNTNSPSRWIRDYHSVSKFIKEKNIHICYFTHLTDFALLLGKKIEGSEDIGTGLITKKDNQILKIITAIGCLLSIIGICGIFLTAIMFESWRQKVGTKVLLNVSGCILLQIVLLYLNMSYSETICIITGSLLHYSILSGFSWALIMAILQYLRFVRVIGGPSPHLLLKASVVGWLLPLVPVMIALVLKKNKYIPNLKDLGSNICYPTGSIFYYTLLLPVILIIIINLIIFFVILYNISLQSKIRNHCTDKRVFVSQVKLTILLFFLLGLTWITGLLALEFPVVEMLYLFCATATLQGFILFLFYVVFDHSTRKLWSKRFRTNATPSKSPQQTIQSTREDNHDNCRKEESDVNRTELADGNARIQTVTQELKSTHRVENGVRSRSTK